MKPAIPGNNSLRITILAGLILFLISAVVFIFIFFIGKSSSGENIERESFNRMLIEYDIMLQNSFLTEGDFEKLNLELDRLENRAVTVESWLSIFKRRRMLVNINPPSLANYHKSINRALKIYPGSQPIMAIAAAALVKDSGINKETEDQLRKWLSNITDSFFNDLLVSFHVILGDFRNPQRAAVISEDLTTDGTEAVTVDLAILKAIRENYRGAAADIHFILNNSPSVSAIRFAADFHYDFGDLLRSAELFSLLDDDASVIRQADALYLAGFPETAANIWTLLTGLLNETSLYNLAVISDNPRETFRHLEKLVSIDTYSNKKIRQFGLIRYSRFLDYSEAIAFLRNNIQSAPKDFPFIDLEIAKRYTHGRDLGRQLAETWLLLDQHIDNEELYMWAAWHFFFQRRFDEAIILLDRLDQLNISAGWIDVYKAIQLMNEGDLNAAESILRSIPREETNWPVFANLGRIYEELNSPSHAIEQYTMAALNAPNPKAASRIQVRMARCYNALGRSYDTRRALEYAVELDPDNLSAKLELERL